MGPARRNYTHCVHSIHPCPGLINQLHHWSFCYTSTSFPLITDCSHYTNERVRITATVYACVLTGHLKSARQSLSASGQVREDILPGITCYLFARNDYKLTIEERPFCLNDKWSYKAEERFKNEIKYNCFHDSSQSQLSIHPYFKTKIVSIATTKKKLHGYLFGNHFRPHLELQYRTE